MEGHACEIPDLVKWFREEHNLIVTRHELRYRLKKMGFIFGKMKKICLRKEGPRIRAKRRIYLMERELYDAKIAINKKKRRDWINTRHCGPVEPELIYIYLDESYVNRNHCLGNTWYHPDDKYGSAANIPSGKGERLVFLTAITEDYGMISKLISAMNEDGEYFVKSTDHLASLMLFQARKASGDYHKNMDGDMFIRWFEDILPILRQRGFR